ncbi:hypothetical protein BVX94_00090 [bacterium B17]|nr:hypothetical protein BVX94_00090 [bacterium B17]
MTKSRPPFSSSFKESFKALLTSKEVWLTPACQLVFLCGKKLDDPGCARKVLLDYAHKHIPESRFFLAEDVFDALRLSGKSPDLLSVESYLARCADSVIIILESDGAKVELGAFAHDDELAKIMLTVNDARFKGEASFISDGPLKKLNKLSKLGPTIYTDLKSIGRVHHLIEGRLKRIRRKKRKRLSVLSAKDFVSLPHKERLFLVGDLIWLLSPVSHHELIALLVETIGDVSYDFLRFELSLLNSLKFITTVEIKKQNYYISASSMAKPFCEYDLDDAFELRSEAIANYHKRGNARLAGLKERE